MDRSYEDVYMVQEKIHPWFQARRSLFYYLLRRTSSFHDKNILDVGCGTGVFLQYLKKKGCKHLEGVEPSLHLKDKTEGNIKIQRDFPKKKYDIILLLDVLEHIKDDDAMLKQIASHLKPNGECIWCGRCQQWSHRKSHGYRQQYQWKRKNKYNYCARTIQ